MKRPGIFLVALGVLSGTGCGYLGPIKPPALDIPQRISDLRAAEFGDRIVVEFTVPALTTEGTPLTSVDAVTLYAGVPSNPFTTESWGAGAKKFDVPATGPGPLTFEIPIADFVGKDLTMAVRAKGPKGKMSDWSNLQTLPVRAALTKPFDLKTENLQGGIQVTWKGAPNEQYRVYRATGAETPSLLDSPKTAEFLDATTDFGTGYRYYVEGHEGELQHSDMAVSAPVLREDTFPPTVPAGLTPEIGSNSIELSWERNTDPRFQGYNVYRSVNDGPFEKVASLIAAPAYSDRDVQAGKKYRYQVSAVGTNGIESARSAPVEITAQ